MAAMIFGLRCLVGLVFAVSATSKVRSRDAYTDFVASLQSMGVRRRAWRRPVGVAVVLAEIAITGFLAAPSFAPARDTGRLLAGTGFVLATVLLVAFTAGIGLAVRRGVRASCRCFGASTTPLGIRHIVRNTMLIAASTTAALAVALGSDDPVHPAAATVAAVAGAVLAVVIVTFDDLVDLFRAGVHA